MVDPPRLVQTFQDEDLILTVSEYFVKKKRTHKVSPEDLIDATHPELRKVAERVRPFVVLEPRELPPVRVDRVMVKLYNRLVRFLRDRLLHLLKSVRRELVV